MEKNVGGVTCSGGNVLGSVISKTKKTFFSVYGSVSVARVLKPEKYCI